MQAAVFLGSGAWRLEGRPEPVVRADDDVVIEVEACGICGTDLQILNMPPGHPAAGFDLVRSGSATKVVIVP